MHDVRAATAALAVLALILVGCGGGADATDGGGGEVDPEIATRESATAHLCELWEQARTADDAATAQAALDAADEFVADLPTNLRQPARGDARMQCGSAEREAKQRIHSERSGD